MYWVNNLRIIFNKQFEFFFKSLLPKKYQFKRRIERSIKNLDEPELAIINELILNGTDSIDVGVYRGVHSYQMSKYSNIVHSFEANPIIFTDLKTYLPKLKKNIQLYNYALSDKIEKKILKVPVRNYNAKRSNYEEYYKMGLASVHENNNFENYEKFEIISKKLDEFKFKNKISFIKIDVEGHEMEVINGSLNLIKKFKPNLMIEIEEKHSKNNLNDSISFINSLGYKAFVYDQTELVPFENKQLNKNNNFIFKPN